MKEFRRIIQDKRFLIVIILILAVNGILEYSEMKPNEEGEAYTVSLYGENYSEKFREARSETAIVHQQAQHGSRKFHLAGHGGTRL